jgi:hypothetical protein
MEKLRYQCVFCGMTIEPTKVDICELNLRTNWEKTVEKQQVQQFFCHATCFRQHVHVSAPLYVLDLECSE